MANETEKKGFAWLIGVVKDAIANIPDELPSGGTAGDFLRKTASGVAWQTVPSAESNSFGGGTT